MQDRPSPYKIPRAFISERVVLTSDELVFGYRHGFATAGDAITLATEKVRLGLPTTEVEEELALLLSHEADQVHDIVTKTPIQDSEKTVRRVWIYLTLAWLHEEENRPPDPWETIDSLHCYFDHADEIAPLVRYMPPPPGEPYGLPAMQARWDRMMNTWAEHYSSRPVE